MALVVVCAVAIVIAGGVVLGLVRFGVMVNTPTSAGLDSVFGIQSGSVDGFGEDSPIPDCAATPCSFYNFTLSRTGGNLSWGNLSFAVRSSDGLTAEVTGGVAVVAASSVEVLGFYDFQNGSWSSQTIANLPVRSSDFLCLFEAGTALLSGDNLTATGPADLPGVVSGTIT